MDRPNTCRSTCAQVLACMAFNTLSLNMGIIYSMPIIVIGALRLYEPQMHFSEEQASWFGGLIFIVQPLGSLVSGLLQDRLGRKGCVMLVNIPQLIAWLLIYKASSITTLFVAEVILGLSFGFMEAPTLSYIGEITEPRLRGVLSCFGFMSFNLGTLLQMVTAALVDWRTMALIDAVWPVVSLIALAFVPESPAWQVAQGKVENAQRGFQWLRGWVRPEDVQEELDDLVSYVEHSGKNPQIVGPKQYDPVPVSEVADSATSPNPPDSQLKIFLHHSVQRPMRLLVMYFFTAMCASLYAMRPFILEFMDQLKLPIASHLVLVISSCLNLLGALSSILLIPRLGKRGVTFISLGLSIACCFGLGLYLGLGVHVSSVPLIWFVVSFYCEPLGILSIPWILISELFPLRGRGLATGVASALAYVIIFLVVKTYYTLVSLLTLPGACFFYGVVGLLGFVYLYFYLPETEGKTLEDIERMFTKNNKNVK